MKSLAKLGAIAYVLWGLLHIESAREVYTFSGTLEPGILQGRMVQHAWNLLFFALFAIVVGATFNWRNSRTGYWLNLVVVSAADIGFILAVLIPGYVSLVPGGLGPVLWVLALIFSSLSFWRAPRQTEHTWTTLG